MHLLVDMRIVNANQLVKRWPTSAHRQVKLTSAEESVFLIAECNRIEMRRDNPPNLFAVSFVAILVLTVCQQVKPQVVQR